jgi:hypothetical protein
MELECPECLTLFEVETWCEITCPSCGRRGWWDECETGDNDWEVTVNWN